MHTLQNRRQVDSSAFAMMVLLCIIWGSQQVAIKLVAADASPLLQVGLRSGIAAVIVSIIVMVRKEHRWLRGRTWRPGALVGALFGLEFVFVGEGLRHTSASHMAIFLYTAPIFAALGLHLTRSEERLNRMQWLGIVVAFGGVVLSFADQDRGPASGTSWLGDLFGIAAGAAWGATTVAVRGSRLSETPATITLLYQLIGAFVLATGVALILGQTIVRTTLALAASITYQSVVVAGFSYLAWFVLLRTYLASRLGVLSFMTPVFGVVAGTTILGEQLGTNFILGAAGIMAGILLVSVPDVLRGRSSAAPRDPDTTLNGTHRDIRSK